MAFSSAQFTGAPPGIKVLIRGNPEAGRGPEFLAAAISRLLHSNGIESGVEAEVTIPTINDVPLGRLPLERGTRVEIVLLVR